MVHLDVNGERIPLRFTWGALADMRARFGLNWAAQVEQAFAELNADAMAAILAAGSDRPADWWLDVSPPLIPCAAAARKALEVAFYGPSGPEPVDPPQAANKKSLTQTWFAAAFGRGRLGVASPNHSGA